MAHKRYQPNIVILPDGSIAVFGGQTDVHPGYVLQAELWNGSGWQPLATANPVSPRGEHSTALLLRNGNVLLAGGDLRSSDSETFVPPQLCGTNPRPQWVTPPPSIIMYATNYEVEYDLPTGATISKVVLMRPGSVTHATNFEQRYVQLSFAVSSPGKLTFTGPAGKPGRVTLPANSNAAPEGYYMLFLVSGQGTWSVAQWVNLQ